MSVLSDGALHLATFGRQRMDFWMRKVVKRGNLGFGAGELSSFRFG